jgi:hypothetical protein
MDKNEFIEILKYINKIHHSELNNELNLENVYNEIIKIFNSTLDNLNKYIVKDLKKEKNKHLNFDAYFHLIGYKYYLKINQKYQKYFNNNMLEKHFKNIKYEILIKYLKKIYLLFNVSEHYYNKIINEYPESSYLEEAKDNIVILKKLNNEILEYIKKE